MLTKKKPAITEGNCDKLSEMPLAKVNSSLANHLAGIILDSSSKMVVVNDYIISPTIIIK